MVSVNGRKYQINVNKTWDKKFSDHITLIEAEATLSTDGSGFGAFKLLDKWSEKIEIRNKCSKNNAQKFFSVGWSNVAATQMDKYRACDQECWHTNIV